MAKTTTPNVIDVDILPDDDGDIVFQGFKRSTERSSIHAKQLETDGLTYSGYHYAPESDRRGKGGNKRKREGSTFQRASSSLERSTRTIVIEILDSDEDQPVPKRPQLSYPAVPASRQSGTTVEEHESDDDYIHYMAALCLDDSANWERGKPQEGHIDIDDPYHAERGVLAAGERALHDVWNRRILDTTQRQGQARVFDWCDSVSGIPHTYQKFQSTLYSVRRHTHASPRIIRPTHELRVAHSFVNTIVQSENIFAVASAVNNGAIDASQNESTYNEEGALSVSERTRSRDFLLNGHSNGREGHRIHYFTVNDVVFDPASPRHLASAGRDHKVCIWDCEPVQRGVPPELLHEVACPDNPEVVKYHPQGSLLAIQSDNGNVYFTRDGSLDSPSFTVASSRHGHCTTGMVWGVGPSDKLIFASSAYDPDKTRNNRAQHGFHRGFDIVKRKGVMCFDANYEACEALALSPSGESLYIATERCAGSYVLRKFSVRSTTKTREADQQVSLEPFTGDEEGNAISTLSISPDDLYIAVGRFAHEIHRHQTLEDTYGVVKAQWVENQPYGSGLVSGGLDGCIRLWDLKRASEDQLNGSILAERPWDISTFSIGDMYKHEVPIIVGLRSGEVTLYDYASHQRELV